MSGKENNILLIEDNPGDIALMKRAITTLKQVYRLNICTNGTDAINYVYRNEGFEDAVVPDLIILDLNLPKISGYEVLSKIKDSKSIKKKIPIVVLTSSDFKEDIEKAYEENVNSYIIKPKNYSKLLEIVKSIEDFWFDKSVLP